jgi:hypothetical protein
MSNDVETLIRSAAPHVTRQPDAFLAALSVSDEAAMTTHSAARKRRHVMTTVGVATVIAFAGTNVAAAATQSLWWSAPNEVVAEATPLGVDVAPVTRVSMILSADYAAGVDGTSPDAQAAFRLAQSWLAERPIVVNVPTEARTLSGGEEESAVEQGIPPQIALEHKAIAATESAVDAAIAETYDELITGLESHLADHGVVPSLVVVDRENGVVEVLR